MPQKAKPRILIVDDDSTFLNTLKDLCSALGCEVVTAGDGTKALEIVSRQTFTLVLSDIRMPNMSGIALLESIESRGIDVPVIIMSGHSDYTAQDIDDRNGVVLLEKPFSAQQLREIIEQYVPLLPNKTTA
jgi:DNA-binding NtrC family response regulator